MTPVPGPLVAATFDNGLAVLVGERPHGAQVVCALLVYHTGSARESKGTTGVSHFLEHMMFKGTGSLAKGEIDRLTQQAGGRNNAFTQQDYTAYYFALAADRWTLALDIEADRMRGCTLDPAEFALEKEVILQELYGALDEPWGLLEQELWATIYRQHPYRHPILGWRDDLERLDVDAMRDHYRRYYHPANATLVVCGAVSAPAVLDYARRTLGRIPPGPTVPPPDPALAEPDQVGARVVEIVGRTSATRVVIAHRGPRHGTVDHDALLLAEAILAEGKCSRLYQRLVDGERLLRSIDAHAEGKREDGVFLLSAELVPGAELARVEAALAEEVARLGREPVTADELARARTQLETGHLFTLERASSWAFAIGHYAAYGWLAGYHDYLERVAAVTPARIQDAAARHLRPERRTTGVHRPDPNDAHEDGDPDELDEDADA